MNVKRKRYEDDADYERRNRSVGLAFKIAWRSLVGVLAFSAVLIVAVAKDPVVGLLWLGWGVCGLGLLIAACVAIGAEA